MPPRNPSTLSRHPRRAPRTRRRGYTLIEVLAALLLVAIVVPTAMEGVALAVHLSSHARHLAEASTLARAKIDELVVTGDWQTNQAGGDFAPEFPDYHWTAAMQDWDGQVVRQLDVEVKWLERGKERSVVLSTLIYTQSSSSDTSGSTGS